MAARKKLSPIPQSERTGQHIGRPRKLPPPDAAERIKAAAAAGYTVPGVAEQLGCQQEILRRWMTDDPALKAAFDAGRDKERFVLHNKLYKDATEGTGKDSILAAMFLLKARHGYREGEQPTDHTNSRVNITIQLPQSLPPEQWAEVVKNG